VCVCVFCACEGLLWIGLGFDWGLIYRVFGIRTSIEVLLLLRYSDNKWKMEEGMFKVSMVFVATQ
jgi:hypothetical protein